MIAGLIFVVHGYVKIGFIGGFAQGLAAMNIPVPDVAAYIVIIGEILGGLALIIGIATRWVGLLLAAEMAFITAVVKMPTVGFLAGQGRGVGAELDLMVMAALLVTATVGSGALSLEGLLEKRRALAT
jgi:putative oxidoreductase